MSKKLTKAELKNPDQMTKELKKGFEWSLQHSKLVFGGSAAFILIGLLWGASQHWLNKKELEEQTRFYQLEKKLLSLEKNPEPDKTANSKPENTKDTSSEKEKTMTELQGEFKDFVAKTSSQRVKRMGVLNWAHLYKLQGLPPPLEIFQSLKLEKDLLSDMIRVLWGTEMAQQEKCKEAIELWKPILDNKSSSHFHAQVKLRTGVCYESLGDLNKAKEFYQSLASENEREIPQAAVAQKYLRALGL